jgi:hypothetical protein
VAVAVALVHSGRGTAGEHAGQPVSPWADSFLHAFACYVGQREGERSRG